MTLWLKTPSIVSFWGCGNVDNRTFPLLLQSMSFGWGTRDRRLTHDRQLPSIASLPLHLTELPADRFSRLSPHVFCDYPYRKMRWAKPGLRGVCHTS